MPSMKNFMGAKPSEFCFWVFDMLGARQGDELVDLFPGTGAVTQAWAFYQATIAPPAVAEAQP
jgi:tRNA/tmRNA/rRNA uracil-C5-methylase (TrmA/RlmC/RlmD family)